jgi:hypothetical protein
MVHLLESFTNKKCWRLKSVSLAERFAWGDVLVVPGLKAVRPLLKSPERGAQFVMALCALCIGDLFGDASWARV